MATVLAPPPVQNVVVSPARLIDKKWVKWLLDVTTRLQKTSQVFRVESLSNQAAAIAATPLPVGALAAGLYRLSYYLRVTTPASGTSSVTFTAGSTESGVNVTQSGPALTSNTTTTAQSGAFLLQADQAAALTYSTAYDSTGATAMQYRLTVLLEGVD